MSVPIKSPPFNWTCPFCRQPQTVSSANFAFGRVHFDVSTKLPRGLEVFSILCVNEECKQVSVTSYLVRDARQGAGFPWSRASGDAVIRAVNILPKASSRPLPDYIPPAIRQDYEEACLIRELSPKASATLARRCLQGMIRDFCKISKKRLIDEINELRKQVEDGAADRSISTESVDAIDAIRTLGNIGAHMEADINQIVDVDADEAQLLIELLESLFDEWYVERSAREARFKRIADLKKIKAAEIAAAKVKAPVALPAPTLPEAEEVLAGNNLNPE